MRSKNGFAILGLAFSLAVVTVATGVVALAAPASPTRAGADAKTFTMARASDVYNFDPANSPDQESVSTVLQLFDRLVKFAPHGTAILPDLATSWKFSNHNQTVVVQAPAGREVLRRVAADAGRRRVLDRASDEVGDLRGHLGKRDQEGHARRHVRRTDRSQAPVRTAPLDSRDLRGQRLLGEELEEVGRQGCAVAPRRHCGVHVVVVEEGQPDRLREEPVLLGLETRAGQADLQRRR